MFLFFHVYYYFCYVTIIPQLQRISKYKKYNFKSYQ
nr:MAG TPA: hypothetical protein [Ackermannviridae sp.]